MEIKKECKVLDYTDKDTTYNSLSDILNINKKCIENYIGCFDDVLDIRIEKFLESIIDENKLLNDIRIDYIICHHLTTTYDECKYIKKVGLTNTRKALQLKTPLNEFLNKNNVRFELNENTCNMYYKNKLQDLTKPERYRWRQNDIIKRLTEDFQINAFLYSNDIVNYSNVKLYPEILKGIDRKLNTRLRDKWSKISKPFILKLKIPINDIKKSTYDNDNDDEFNINSFSELDKYKWLIKQGLKYLYGIRNNSIKDKIIFLNDESSVSPNNIKFKEVQR